ncbi:Peroxidase [Thalictrum thalictroides]|uniref:Peroxidase n=1 Tax=Thalictrum thalictroides TaxID=46969 RepID=A0A7J6VVH9_THATH|nr:Peroxidase [Thalictrum thalictroides]
MLSTEFYDTSCPEAETIISSAMSQAIKRDPTLAASLLRLHFHDCFVQGCDASVFLDDTRNHVGEKSAAPNFQSLRGFDVIDTIKAELEKACPHTVSCSDILAAVARDSVVLSGGPKWNVEFGRRDSLMANKTAVLEGLPNPNSDVAGLLPKFEQVGMSLRDMVALSGGHTIGSAKCVFLKGQRPNSSCSRNESHGSLDQTPKLFDNNYYLNLLEKNGNGPEGFLESDNALVRSTLALELVQIYATNATAFFADLRTSMIKMGRVAPLLGSKGESGGPKWNVEFGRRDSLMANKTAVLEGLPNPNSDIAEKNKNGGFLESDNSLVKSTLALELVQVYAKNATAFFSDFTTSMIKMALLGSEGEVRINCHRMN